MARESVVIDTDAVDTSHVEEPWWDLAQQLKQDLASVILMSEDDLQVIDQHQSSVSLFVMLVVQSIKGPSTVEKVLTEFLLVLTRVNCLFSELSRRSVYRAGLCAGLSGEKGRGPPGDAAEGAGPP